MWNYIVLTVFIFILLVIWVRRVEYFASAYNAQLQYKNSGDGIHQRAPVHTSIMDNIDFKYKKAYNYEMENKEYGDALRKTFKIEKVCIDTNSDNWNEQIEVVNDVPLDLKLEQTYKYTIDYIQNKLKESEFFQLPDMQINSIQVLHDILLNYQTHKILPLSIYTIQLVLYRESKYHAKDVGMIVRVDKEKGMYIIDVLDVWINGIIFEDKFGMFPVIANDPLLIANQQIEAATLV